MPVLNTPVVKKAPNEGCNEVNDKERAETDEEEWSKTFLQYGANASRYIVGPMPPQEFVDTFIPDCKTGMPSPMNAFNSVPTKSIQASDIYTALAACLNISAQGEHSRCPGYRFDVTAERGVPDICMHANADVVAPIPTDARLGLVHLFFEVRPEYEVDFFDDPPDGVSREAHHFVLNTAHENYEKALEEASKDWNSLPGVREQPEVVWQEHCGPTQEDLGLNVYYSAQIFARQHRWCSYSVSLFGARARLIRWDRSGAVATEAFDIKEHPQFLCEFLWRYAHATDEERGFDTSVEWATHEDEELFKRVLTQHVKLQLDLPNDNLDEDDQEKLDEAVAEHYERGKVVRMNVLEDGHPTVYKVHSYLVSRPANMRSLFGSRSSRGYWAISAETHKIAFLKDIWRYNFEGAECEGIIHGRLAQAGVRNIPPLLHHGDVPLNSAAPTATDDLNQRGDQGLEGQKATFLYQITMTNHFGDSPWACTQARNRKVSLTPRIHYRLVFGTVGYPLERLEGTHDLLHGTFDAFEAMIDAHKKAQMLHRNINIKNIMLVREETGGPKKGYLIGWELAGSVGKHSSQTGEPRFMSIAMFKEENFIHHITDDMESLMYVVMYCGLLWLPHNIRDLGRLMREFFDAGKRCEQDGRLIGGNAKVFSNVAVRFTRRHRFKCECLQEWLTVVLDLHGGPLKGDTRPAGRLWKGPDDLHAFWNEFLVTKDLVKDNRQVHKIRW